MTCTDYRSIVLREGDALACSTTAELAGAIVHLDRCSNCWEWTERIDDGEGMSAAEDALRDRMLSDPEAVEILTEAGIHLESTS